ncbi:uncharacterized protein LOC131846570 [Achroia grisella]|uniref:uncharacterized protein LOC131846570 n=1 Tax=Achroia grisella TaxID=688607 RepID=UPI0027D2FC9E|nr:uncharacterized protein LOC131846570 [Achroia grisella]
MKTVIVITPQFCYFVTAKTKTELTPISITCGLNDIIVISGPVINRKGVRYYLYRPNGDITRLNITRFKNTRKNGVNHNDKDKKPNYEKYNFIVVKNVKPAHRAVISPLIDYKVFNVNNIGENEEWIDMFSKIEEEMNSNDFMIGPLGVNDHGNWMLSLYYKDLNEEWLEMFQVITIKIIEPVPASARRSKTLRGDTFHFGFSYPIVGLTACELTAPQSTFDKFYERDISNWDTCGYIVSNLTRNDEGMWRIIGVGRIVYETQVYLQYT